MKIFSSGDLSVFLRAVDDELDQPFSLLIIGGGAASLAYGVKTHTHDIDTLNTENFQFISDICKTVREKTGLDIPISEVTVADAPYHFEDRLIRDTSLNLQKLMISFPEKHDLALMKIIRGDAHDFQHIREIADSVGLEYTVLSERFADEMGHVISDSDRLRLNFLCMIEYVFGEDKAEETENIIRKASGINSGAEGLQTG